MITNAQVKTAIRSLLTRTCTEHVGTNGCAPCLVAAVPCVTTGEGGCTMCVSKGTASRNCKFHGGVSAEAAKIQTIMQNQLVMAGEIKATSEKYISSHNETVANLGLQLWNYGHRVETSWAMHGFTVQIEHQDQVQESAETNSAFSAFGANSNRAVGIEYRRGESAREFARRRDLVSAEVGREVRRAISSHRSGRGSAEWLSTSEDEEYEERRGRKRVRATGSSSSKRIRND